MMTEVLSKETTLRHKQTIQGSVANPAYGVQESVGPFEYNAALDNAAGALVYVVLTNVEDRRASRIAGGEIACASRGLFVVGHATMIRSMRMPP